MLTTNDDPINPVDMMSAAVSRSLRVLRMRPAGFAGSSVASPRINGITATPVSNPLRPSASFGKIRKTTATSMSQSPPGTTAIGDSAKTQSPVWTFAHQSSSTAGCSAKYKTPDPMTMMLSTR